MTGPLIMKYSIHPRIYRLQHEVNTLQRHMHNAQRRMGMSNPAILHNYREMIRTREEMVELLMAQQEIPTLNNVASQ
jgi:hypothetical protein